MSRRGRILFLLVAWLIILMPFLFWRGTWFGLPLSDGRLDEYLHDEARPRHIQHALVQLSERMRRREPGVARWYADLVRLAGHPVEEIRNTDAWVMGQDPSRPEFHQALLKLLNDGSPLVRGNAALSLLSFGDAAGHAQIVSMLQPAAVTATSSGRVVAVARAGEPIRQGTILARIDGARTLEVRSPISGRVRSVGVQAGAQIATGTEIAVIEPGADQVWEALRALYLIGQPEDLPVIAPFKSPSPNSPDRIRQQAELTEKAILNRAGQ